MAQQRARANGGTLVLRNDDLDSTRYKMEFVEAMFGDLKWFGFDWQEGPDRGGSFGPYNQSERRSFYSAALEKLKKSGAVYPCTCSRKDILNAIRAPHAEDDNEPIYPGTCRGNSKLEIRNSKFAWRFRVPDGETISFTDGLSRVSS